MCSLRLMIIHHPSIKKSIIWLSAHPHLTLFWVPVCMTAFCYWRTMGQTLHMNMKNPTSVCGATFNYASQGNTPSLSCCVNCSSIGIQRVVLAYGWDLNTKKDGVTEGTQIKSQIIWDAGGRKWTNMQYTLKWKYIYSYFIHVHSCSIS